MPNFFQLAGFEVTKYRNVQDMSDKTALRFFKQVRALVSQRQRIRRYYAGAFTDFDELHLSVIDEVGYPELQGINDDEGDDFIAGIIVQRIQLVKEEEHRASSEYWARQKESIQRDTEAKQTKKWMIDRSQEAEKEREEKKNRYAAARAEVKVYLYNRKKKEAEVDEKRRKQEEKADRELKLIAKIEKAEKKQKKEIN